MLYLVHKLYFVFYTYKYDGKKYYASFTEKTSLRIFISYPSFCYPSLLCAMLETNLPPLTLDGIKHICNASLVVLSSGVVSDLKIPASAKFYQIYTHF